jgi:hypothetical protein
MKPLVLKSQPLSSHTFTLCVWFAKVKKKSGFERGRRSIPAIAQVRLAMASYQHVPKGAWHGAVCRLRHRIGQTTVIDTGFDRGCARATFTCLADEQRYLPLPKLGLCPVTA